MKPEKEQQSRRKPARASGQSASPKAAKRAAPLTPYQQRAAIARQDMLALLRWDREWMAAHFEPLSILYPEPGYALALDRSPAFQTAHGSASVPVLEGAVKVAWRNLAVVFFLAATSALSILFTLCRLGGESTDSALREADLAVLAPQFGVSRSHIRNMLLAAEQHGFLARHGDKGQFIVLTPLWVEAFDRFIADSLSYSDVTYRLGQEVLDRQILDRESSTMQEQP